MKPKPPTPQTPPASRSGSVTLTLPYTAPFDWPRLLRFLAGRATPGVEAVDANTDTYQRVVEWAGVSGLLTVRCEPQRAVLLARLDGAVSQHADALAKPLTHLFDLHADPGAIQAHFCRDLWLGPLLAAAPGLRVPGAWSGFELVVRAIVGQQVSVKAATTLTGRLVQRAGQLIVEAGPAAQPGWRFPTPERLASADLTNIGMPGKRVAALQGFAQAVASGDLPLEPAAADCATLRAKLLALPGIGPWTVEYVAMRAWRDADAWPSTDLVLMQAIMAREPALVRPAQQRERTEAWRPWRAYAAMHLWNEIADRAGAARGG
ncbi:DNA-3-methyladenine glycosylase [Paraburkholderia bonniea]|uniref:DNA-3-methyladenine glycosylase family protein n=1 Tax=Paraburkholderia bonniea TaxID=2152891 RepID=UPI001291A06A|nr:DNA-3-methyladenine glycosylase [Paraburkholderia bonniea]WJF90100.1 DNA-3-methyladenine glycosylase [Paraburkholderia bonniea]WJF93414.1 DNA-3-methyladenine glycosylase [Paraburkholderia bonniea]